MSLGQWGRPWQQRRPPALGPQPPPAPEEEPRLVCVVGIIDLANYFPPGWTGPPDPDHPIRARGADVRIGGERRGELVSDLDQLGNGQAQGLFVVTATDRELELSFPAGYTIDPTFQGAPE